MRYNSRGNLQVISNDTSSKGVLTYDGYLRVTSVTGNSWTGLYAPDGSFNVVIVGKNDANTGLYHPCGAMRAVAATSEVGMTAPSGAFYMEGLTVSYDPPVLTWNLDTEDFSPDFTAVFDYRASTGQSVLLQFASDYQFTTDLVSYPHVITADEIAGGLLSIDVVSLDYGTWYARLSHEDSDWSNIEAIVYPSVNAGSFLLMEDGSKYLQEDDSSYYLLE